MHCDEEHAPRELRFPLRVRKVPNGRARLLVQLRLHHHLLHLAVSQRAALVRVEHTHHVEIVFLFARLNVPGALLLLKTQIRYLHIGSAR